MSETMETTVKTGSYETYLNRAGEGNNRPSFSCRAPDRVPPAGPTGSSPCRLWVSPTTVWHPT